MRKPAIPHRLALKEARFATSYYSKKSKAAARQFVVALNLAFDRIETTPGSCSLHLHGTRICLLKKFPFFVVFSEFPTHCVIYAVAHAKRKPGYWRGRQTRP